MNFCSARTASLEIAYEEHGGGFPVILLHGFPYDPRCFDEVASELAGRGYRVIVPYLRGYGPTRFLSPAAMRSGQQAALGADLLALMDALAHEGQRTPCGQRYCRTIAKHVALSIKEWRLIISVSGTAATTQGGRLPPRNPSRRVIATPAAESYGRGQTREQAITPEAAWSQAF